MTKNLRNIFTVLAMGLCLTACKDDDSIDYTQYYGWRDKNNALSATLIYDARNSALKAYFSDTIPSLSEPFAFYTMKHVIESANEDSLRKINRWITPYYTSTLKVHYTLYDTESVFDRFEEYGILSDLDCRNNPELMNKIFGIGYRYGMEGYELKADTLESSQVKFFENFNCGSVVKGWSDCLQTMHIGDSWLIMVPWYLGYGQAGSGSIGPYTNLFFRIQLVDITYWGDTPKNQE